MESANLEEMAEKLSQIPLAYDPGEDWMYSSSIDVLGRVIEAASGQSLDRFLSRLWSLSNRSCRTNGTPSLA